MMKRFSFLILVGLLVSGTVPPASAQKLGDFPPDMQAVFRYLLKKERPEQYEKIQVKLRPRGYEIVDIDDDGTKEVFFWHAPHFHQTPTILIYQVVARDSVKRVLEGLAPGPLVPASGKMGDSHKTGLAADTRFESASKGDKAVAIRSFMRYGMQVVEYPHFYHTARAGNAGGYVDMRHQARFLDQSVANCSPFQFANTAALTSGHIGDTGHRYLVAFTGDTMDIIRIKSIDRFGMLEKTIWRIDAPKNFNGFVKGVDESIRYWNEKEEQIKIEVDFANLIPISGTN